MPRDFDRRSSRRKQRPTRPQDEFGIFVENLDSTPPRRRPFTIWNALGVLAGMAFGFLILYTFLGTGLLTFLLTPLVGLVLYEAWYLAFESVV